MFLTKRLLKQYFVLQLSKLMVT